MASNAVMISADNRGPWIIIVTWILGVVMLLASFIKVITKWVMSRKIQYDDLYMVAAAVGSPTSATSLLRLERLNPSDLDNRLRHRDLIAGKGWTRKTLIRPE